ncbi:putative nucleotidyltransferase, ribonuclease H [Tanacetum coccineum]|uniref:Nucleotidyltransferase, ribonuclease H n=1 Tax=Tanacetum coccineum TaxID=301880 RepID=A0ABQ5F165_9ASTR
MNSPPNHEWEEGLDIDDSDLLLTPVIRPTNNTHIVPEITTTQTLFSSQNNQVDNCVVKPIRIISGPASTVQTTKLYKLVDTREGREESVMSTQEYIRKIIEDVGEDDDFTCAPWLSAIEYMNVDGWIVTGCFGDVKKFLKNGKLEQIVAVIKSCTPNALADLTVTLKDLSGTISSTIHYKVLTEERYGYIKNHKKTVKNEQARTREPEEYKAKARKAKP